MPNLRLLAALLLVTTPTLFPTSTDIGKTKPGTTTFNPTTATYTLTGGGGDMWSTADDFHLAWTRLTGDATLTADITLPPDTTLHPLRKAVLIFRQSLAPTSPYADIALHGDGHITLQYRQTESGETADQNAPVKGPLHLRITRHGTHFTAATAAGSQPFTTFATIDIPMQAELYAGLGVCAHDATSTIPATFTHVTITQPVP